MTSSYLLTEVPHKSRNIEQHSTNTPRLGQFTQKWDER
jgi:hypothetical protein